MTSSQIKEIFAAINSSTTARTEYNGIFTNLSNNAADYYSKAAWAALASATQWAPQSVEYQYALRTAARCFVNAATN